MVVKTNLEALSNHSVEIVKDNIVSKEIQKMFRPLNIMLNIFVTPKYSIRNNYITPNNKKSIIIISLSVLVVLILCGYRVIYKYIGNKDSPLFSNNVLYFLTVSSFFIFCFRLASLFVFNTINRYNNVILLMKIQEIHEGSNFNAKSSVNFYYWNWFTGLAVISTNLLLVICYNRASTFQTDVFFIIDFATDIFLFATYDINLVYAVRLLMLLTKYLRLWRNNIILMTDNNKGHYDKMLAIYVNILMAYSLFNQIFHVLVFLHVGDTFFCSLFYIKMQLELLTLEPDSCKNSVITSTIVWVMKGIILVVWLCVRCENFYTAVHDAESACMVRLAERNCSDDEKHFCKCVIHLKQQMFRKMSSCGIFYVDGVLPLSLLGLITSYTIVLLQFAIL